MATEALAGEQLGGAESKSWWVERHSIDPIPLEARNGKLWTSFTIWAALNANVLSIAAGAVGIGLKLPIWACLVAIVVGSLFGGFLTAMHAQQGPWLGLPQMIQSRAQFGFFGNLPASLGAIFTFYVYGVLTFVFVDQGLSALLGWSTVTCVVVAAVVAYALALIGYRVVHLANAGIALLSGVLFVLFAIPILGRIGQIHYAGAFTWTAFLFVVSFEVVSQLTNACYMSDYTRYLPRETKGRYVFIAAFGGGTGAAILFTAVGVFAGALNFNAFNTDAASWLGALYPAIATLLVVALVLCLDVVNAMNFYSFYETSLALVTSRGGRVSAITSRAAVTGACVVVCAVSAVAMSSNLINDMGNLVSAILYFIIPWSAINLTDYFILRKGHYDAEEIAERRGRYGLVNWRGLGVYVLGFAVQIPFITSAVPNFTGPVASAMGGLNFAWLVGFAVSAGGYWLVMRDRSEAGVAAAGGTARDASGR